MLVDHCFGLKGKGTVVTGTVISGNAKPGDEIELPEIGETKKIKSMQMFKKPINMVTQGDRCALLVPNLDHNKVERTIIIKPGSLKAANVLLGTIAGVKYHKFQIKSKTKVHLSIGNRTVMAKIFLFQHKSEFLKLGSPLTPG
jgi:selenocysteine-specific elongation factor